MIWYNVAQPEYMTEPFLEFMMTDSELNNADDSLIELKKRIEELEAQKKELELKVAAAEIRSEKILCLFTKSNVERMKVMSDYLNTSRNDLLNRLVEQAYASENYKTESVCKKRKGRCCRKFGNGGHGGMRQT